MNQKFAYTFSLILILSFFACKRDNADAVGSPQIQTTSQPRFSLLSPSQTNIDFVNTLDEGLNTNVLLYEYFYNGGGVATGDFSGDGMIDIYFTSNMGENRFYLNRGNLKFEDITQVSGASGRSGPWKTGVAIVDINGDNRLDLYLCYSGTMPEPKRANQLFINQGNDTNGIPVFKEEAARYGLDNKGFSNQSYYFDYDRDGDLDMLLLNHNPKSLPVLNEANTAKMMAQDDPYQGVRLYQQDDGRFNDVTGKAGINGSPLTYGLGIGISDINDDGWPDFYVSNDYTIPDYLYINNKDGTFDNELKESLRYNSHFSMGNDIADLNNDGWQDIITLDMLPEDNHRQKLLMVPDNYSKFDLNVRSGFHFQYMRNMLQLNNGPSTDPEQVTFSEIGQLAGISNTDWSWAALAGDYDNDGWKDLYVTNGYHRDYTNLDFINYMNDFVAKKGRLQKEDVMEIINNMPSSDVVNYMFSNDKLSFSNKTKEWGLDHISNSNGAAYADLDNDGDLDLVVNNINRPAFVFRNDSDLSSENNYLDIELKGGGKNTLGIGTQVSISIGNEVQKLEQFTSRGYLSAVSPILHFGLGKETTVDVLEIIWPNGKSQRLENISSNQSLTLDEENASEQPLDVGQHQVLFSKSTGEINYENAKQTVRDFDRQPLLISELSHQGPCLAKGDLDGDGLEDIFIGGGKGQSGSIYLQGSNKQFVLKNSGSLEKDKNSEDTNAEIFDANGDGHADLYVASGGYHDFQLSNSALNDRLYINDGKGNFSRSADALPLITQSNSALAVNDINGDGYPDIFIGARVVPGRYPEMPSNTMLINDGTGKFSNEIDKLAPTLKNYGMITDAEWIDLNDDGRKDLVVVGEWTAVSAFAYSKGKFENRTAEYFDKEYRGWWNTIEVADFNNDNKPDLIGNLGRNSQCKASEDEPAELFYSDFDENGSVDPIFCFYVQGKRYPFVSRDELVKQLAYLRSKFNTYKSYADAGIEDIFQKREIDNAAHLLANHMETSLFLRSEEGKFRYVPLPIQVQYAPVYAIHVMDYDKDGNPDVLLCGNNSKTKLRLGSMEGNYGALLRGNGQGGFEYIPQSKSGLNVQGDVKGILQIDDILFFGINQKRMVAYRIN